MRICSLFPALLRSYTHWGWETNWWWVQRLRLSGEVPRSSAFGHFRISDSRPSAERYSHSEVPEFSRGVHLEMPGCKDGNTGP